MKRNLRDEYMAKLIEARRSAGYDVAPEPIPPVRQRLRAEPPPLAKALPDWLTNFEKLDETSKLAWDERVRRMEDGTATEDDIEVQAAAREALGAGRALPLRARKMPGPPLSHSARSWRADQPSPAELATRLGIPPLIAERITAGDSFDTKSTRACARVNRDYLILVLIGERGCGKTFAAAQWLWREQHRAPPTIPRNKLKPRRFVEAVSYADVPFDERTAVGYSVGLVVDDAGTEKDFLVNDLAALFVARYKNALPTVITTNLSTVEFGERYGMRFVDRMREVGKFLVVSNDASDSLRGGT